MLAKPGTRRGQGERAARPDRGHLHHDHGTRGPAGTAFRSLGDRWRRLRVHDDRPLMPIETRLLPDPCAHSPSQRIPKSCQRCLAGTFVEFERSDGSRVLGGRRSVGPYLIGTLGAVVCLAGLWALNDLRGGGGSDSPLSALVGIGGLLGGSTFLVAAYLGGGEEGDVPQVIVRGLSLVGAILGLPVGWLACVSISSWIT